MSFPCPGALDLRFAAVLLDDPFGYGQPESDSCFLGGEVRLEDLRYVLGAIPSPWSPKVSRKTSASASIAALRG